MAGTTSYKLISANTTNDTLVRTGPGTVVGIQVSNVNAAARFLKFYDKATAPTVGTDTPIKTLLIPGGGTVGALTIVPCTAGIGFTLGIGIGLTSAVADNSTSAVAAAEIVVNLDYL